MSNGGGGEGSIPYQPLVGTSKLCRGQFQNKVCIIVGHKNVSLSVHYQSLRLNQALTCQCLTFVGCQVVPNQRVNSWCKINYKQVAKTIGNDIIRHAKAA